MLSQTLTGELASEGPMTRLHVPEGSLPHSQVPQAHTVHLWPELFGGRVWNLSNQAWGLTASETEAN